MDKEIAPTASNEENGAVAEEHQESDDYTYDPNENRDQPSSSWNGFDWRCIITTIILLSIFLFLVPSVLGASLVFYIYEAIAIVFLLGVFFISRHRKIMSNTSLLLVAGGLLLVCAGAATATAILSRRQHYSYTVVKLGRFHSCAITVDDKFQCWGDNFYGQAGAGPSTTPHASTIYEPKTVRFRGSDGVVEKFSLGDGFTCVIMNESKRLLCWGRLPWYPREPFGSHVPVEVDFGPNQHAIAISAGNSHACAITTYDDNYDNESIHLKCFGENRHGQIGDGTTTNAETPRSISFDSNATVIHVSLGMHRTCAILSDNTLYCWGENGSGVFGDDTIDKRTPTKIDVGGEDDEYAIQVSLASSHICLITNKGALKCWGNNVYGKINDEGLFSSGYSIPITINVFDVYPSKDEILQVSLGDYHSCVRLKSGFVKCWGANYEGQLGQGTHNSKANPYPKEVEFRQGSKVLYLGAGQDHSCAIVRTDNENSNVYCWGANYQGQIGLRSGRFYPFPQLM